MPHNDVYAYLSIPEWRDASNNHLSIHNHLTLNTSYHIPDHDHLRPDPPAVTDTGIPIKMAPLRVV
jgi:hypothetical protein